jgi:hypothetical protein
MCGFQMMATATSNHALVEVGAQFGQRHFAKARKQQSLGIVKGLIEGGMYCLFNKAAGRLRPISNGQ